VRCDYCYGFTAASPGGICFTSCSDASHSLSVLWAAASTKPQPPVASFQVHHLAALSHALSRLVHRTQLSLEALTYLT
jgi:hypothetical protein